jgi:tyrosyl-tRNA synthetase
LTFYIGFDPTADSLHIGHFVQLMAMAHMQRAGHRPIALIGGGTGMIGDPSGRSDLRQMMTPETVQHNCDCFKKQMEKFIDFSEGKALMLNNADWLINLNYIDFLRDIGVYFSVNKMLTAECYKKRLEKGLSFLEFNYMLMQAYDFLYLNRNYNCSLELGGDDQWNNILAGADLIRRKEQKPAFAMTFALLTTSEGIKMGKTAKGAVWLDENKTSPYEFYQYWRNVDDADVEKCFNLLTFLPIEEIKELVKYKDERMNAAKVKLAYEITKLIHGEEKATNAMNQAQAAFSNNAEDMEAIEIDSVKCQTVADLLVETKVCKSKGEARRLIDGGGVALNDTKVTAFDMNPSCVGKEFILHKGKKVHIKIKLN